MNERGPKPLSKEQRFIASAFSEGLQVPSIRRKIQEEKKNNSGIFADWYGDATFNSDIAELFNRGDIKVVLTEQGKRDLEDYQRKRAMPRSSAVSSVSPRPVYQPYQGPLRPLYEETRRPIRPEPRPYPRRAEPARKEPPRPESQVRPVGGADKDKPKKKERLSLQDLAKVRDQFRPE